MTKLTLSICLFLFCYFKAKDLKCSKYSRSFLNSHIYIRNGVLVSKTKKSNASLPSVFSPSQTIHSASSCPLPNISISVYARWLHFPSFSANQSSQNALSKSTMKSRPPASLSTLLVSCFLSSLQHLKLQMAPFFSQLPFCLFVCLLLLGSYLLLLCWLILFSSWVFHSQLKFWICMLLFSTLFILFPLLGQS